MPLYMICNSLLSFDVTWSEVPERNNENVRGIDVCDATMLLIGYLDVGST
jgi:hypothetical protein